MNDFYNQLVESLYPKLAGKETPRYFPQAAVDSIFLEWLKIEKNREELGVTDFNIETLSFLLGEAEKIGTHPGNPEGERVNIVIDGKYAAIFFRYNYDPIGLGAQCSKIRFIRVTGYRNSHDVVDKICESFAHYLKDKVSFENLSVRAMMMATGLQR